MTPPPRHARGRHARPPSAFATKCHALLRAVSRVPAERRVRRKAVAAGAGVAAVAVLGTGAAIGLSAAGGPGREPQARSAAVRPSAPAPTRSPAQTPAQARAADADPDAVPDAVAFFQRKDPKEKVAKHVEKVRRSGSFLRVYTDLPEGDENSDDAVSLCEWSAEFLEHRMGDDKPVVFVHAKENDNGNVVLANKQSPKDDCKVGDTR